MEQAPANINENTHGHKLVYKSPSAVKRAQVSNMFAIREAEREISRSEGPAAHMQFTKCIYNINNKINKKKHSKRAQFLIEK